MTQANRIATLLNLKPLPVEGAYFVETYRSPEGLAGASLPQRYAGDRSLSTAIYYLVTASAHSAMHRLLSDEVYHFYLGAPVELLAVRPDGSFNVHILGPDLLGGQQPQVVISRGVWQGCRLRPGGDFALLGTTVAPGFDPADYEHGRREALTRLCPGARDLLEILADE